MNSFNNDLIQIRKGINKGLPGFAAQQKLAPELRSEPTLDYLQRHPDFKTACVVVLIYPMEGQSILVLIERSDFGNHAGQISLPGGKKELDESHMQTAIREAFEETGIVLLSENFMGELSQIYIPPSNFLVHPFIFSLPERPALNTNNREVKRIIELPLHRFMQDGVIQRKSFRTSGGTEINAPCYNINGIQIWGATAMIISEFITLIEL